MPDDLLSDVLTPLRLRGVFHSRWSARAPWAIRGRDEHVAIIHYVIDGECLMIGRETVRLRAGDLAVFPHGAAHELADARGRPAVALDEILPERRPGTSDALEIGGTGARTTFLCGGLHYDEFAESPLYRALPRMLVLDRATLAARPLLSETLERLAAETERRAPGARLVALRAFELVFILALGVALESLDGPVLRALRHPSISRALRAIETRFDEPWTLESLAREAGMSRSAFAAAFGELVGETPARHLTGRRMQEAARLLAETDLPQARIPARVGYDSAVGFHLAFRKRYGSTPGDYRRSRTAARQPVA